MFFATYQICVENGFYDGSNYTESVYEMRLSVAPSKMELYQKLRKLGKAPHEMKDCVRELPTQAADFHLLTLGE